MPVPVRDATVGVFASLTKERLPEAAPVVFGVKATVNDTLCPPATVSGNESPLKANSGLLKVAEETVMLALPVDRVPV